jgi:hypothetical protein
VEQKHRLAEANMTLQTKQEMARSEDLQARMVVLEVELCKIRSSTFQKEDLLNKEVGMLREEVALQRDALVRRDEILAGKNLCIAGLEKQIVEERSVAQDSHERVSALYSREEWNGVIKTRQLMDTREELETVIKSKAPKQRQEIFAARLLVTKFKNSTFTKDCLRNMVALATQIKAFDIEKAEREERSPQSELLEWLDTANTMLGIQTKSKKGKCGRTMCENTGAALARSHEVREHLELSYGVLGLAVDTLLLNIARHQVATTSFANLNVELVSENAAKAEELEKLKQGMVEEDRRFSSFRQQAHISVLANSRDMNFLRSPKAPGSNPPRSPTPRTPGSKPVSRGSSQPSSRGNSPARDSNILMEPRSPLPARRTRASVGSESPSTITFNPSMPLSPNSSMMGSPTSRRRSLGDKSGPASELPPLSPALAGGGWPKRQGARGDALKVPTSGEGKWAHETQSPISSRDTTPFPSRDSSPKLMPRVLGSL